MPPGLSADKALRQALLESAAPPPQPQPNPIPLAAFLPAATLFHPSFFSRSFPCSTTSIAARPQQLTIPTWTSPAPPCSTSSSTSTIFFSVPGAHQHVLSRARTPAFCARTCSPSSTPPGSPRTPPPSTSLPRSSSAWLQRVRRSCSSSTSAKLCDRRRPLDQDPPDVLNRARVLRDVPVPAPRQGLRPRFRPCTFGGSAASPSSLYDHVRPQQPRALAVSLGVFVSNSLRFLEDVSLHATPFTQASSVRQNPSHGMAKRRPPSTPPAGWLRLLPSLLHPWVSRAAGGKELLCWFHLMQYSTST
ncbi:uncharacterized protein [Lolium perenne]|uniref:uncharacterized protein n=1 Tax=Lolium perenne TaxID=4522 RepID=UPI003A9A0D30